MLNIIEELMGVEILMDESYEDSGIAFVKKPEVTAEQLKELGFELFKSEVIPGEISELDVAMTDKFEWYEKMHEGQCELRVSVSTGLVSMFVHTRGQFNDPVTVAPLIKAFGIEDLFETVSFDKFDETHDESLDRFRAEILEEI